MKALSRLDRVSFPVLSVWAAEVVVWVVVVIPVSVYERVSPLSPPRKFFPKKNRTAATSTSMISLPLPPDPVPLLRVV